jgi:hypothetical protein
MRTVASSCQIKHLPSWRCPRTGSHDPYLTMTNVRFRAGQWHAPTLRWRDSDYAGRRKRNPGARPGFHFHRVSRRQNICMAHTSAHLHDWQTLQSPAIRFGVKGLEAMTLVSRSHGFFAGSPIFILAGISSGAPAVSTNEPRTTALVLPAPRAVCTTSVS